MKKTVLFALFLILAVAVLGLTSCGCEHEWKETSVAKEATCLETGERVLTCSKCGETKNETIPKTDHEYDAGVDVVKNGCETEGQKLFTCKICNATKTEITPAKGGHLWNGGRITVNPTCTMEGTREFVCNRCGGTRTEPVAATGKHTYSENYIIVKAPTATSAGEARAYCETCVNSYLTKSVTLTEYNTMKTKAINASNAVAASSFGGTTYTKMSTTAYAAPVTSPKAGQHPRLLFTADDLPAIREAMANDVDANELKSVISAALEYDSAILGATSTKTSSDRYGPRGTHNCNEAKLRCIIAKAFLYQVYGTDLYGYQAIRMMKEYITTLKIESVNDSCRYYGYTMFVSALVYDWCYDLLTETDKTEIICGIQYKLAPGMEVGFPPSGQGALAGHGSERQILRDYLSVALAIYDEEPTWYAFIGGRFYADYVPVRNTYYLSDFTPQGISTYVQIRFTSDLWSAWLMKSATGANPYIKNMGNVMESYLCHIVNGDTEIFESGDDELKDATERLKSMDLAFAISGYLYDDDTLWTWLDYFKCANVESALYYILAQNRGTGRTNTSTRFDNLDLIRYNAGFLGQMITHNKYALDGASTYMKVGGRSTGNHDHADAGSFQIYYKGLLTGDTGVYDSYGSTHHNQYHQSTIAHNSIVIQKTNVRTGKTGTYGQNRLGETASFSTWQGPGYEIGTVTGAQYAYADAEQKDPIYAYIAGNNTSAYTSANLVDNIERRMLTVYDTDNPDIPMYFFVYDDITTKSATDTKVFLLHSYTEPKVDTAKKTVTISSPQGGKLVLTNVVGGDNITLVGGGEGKNYIIDGTQVAPKDEKTDGSWGRVEISCKTGNTNDVMLNVMYVTDAGKTPAVTATSFGTSEESDVTGTNIGNTTAVFVKGNDRKADAFSFTSTGTGTVNYFVDNVKAGKWEVVDKDGKVITTATATEEGGLLTFTAEAGYLNIRPVH